MVTPGVVGGAFQDETWASQSGIECCRRPTCVVLECGDKVCH